MRITKPVKVNKYKYLDFKNSGYKSGFLKERANGNL